MTSIFVIYWIKNNEKYIQDPFEKNSFAQLGEQNEDSDEREVQTENTFYRKSQKNQNQDNRQKENVEKQDLLVSKTHNKRKLSGNRKRIRKESSDEFEENQESEEEEYSEIDQSHESENSVSEEEFLSNLN